MVKTLCRYGDLRTVNITGGSGGSLVRLGRKIGGVLKAAARSLISADIGALYITAEGGRGIVYTLLIVATALLRRRRVFIHHHSYNYINVPSPLMRLLVSIPGPRQTHIFLSETMRLRFEHIYGAQPATHVISNCAFIPPIEEVASKTRSDERIIVGHISNLMTEKGVFTFLDLVEQLAKDGLGIKAVLAGAAADGSVQKEIDRRCAVLASIVDYRGALYGPAKQKFYRDIDVFVFPTQYRNEAQPAVIFEAMSAGAAVVAYDRGSIAEQVGTTGHVVPQDADFVQAFRAFVPVYAERRGDGSAHELVAKAYARQREIAVTHLQDFISDIFR